MKKWGERECDGQEVRGEGEGGESESEDVRGDRVKI